MQTGIIGLPSGSLFKATVELLGKIGIKVYANGRNFMADVEGISIFTKAFITRPDRIPIAVASGKVDLGITGWDFVVEKKFNKKVVMITKLNYSKNSRYPARIVVFSKKDEIIDNPGIKVLSEYPEITKNIFKESLIEVSTGTTEADVAFGVYDYGVGVMETGKSLTDNGLKILRVILPSPVVIIAREKTKYFEILGEMLRGALKAEKYKLIKFNADLGDRDKFTSIRSLESPTINNLANGDIAIETVIFAGEVSDRVMMIRKMGGRDIIIQDINVTI